MNTLFEMQTLGVELVGTDSNPAPLIPSVDEPALGCSIEGSSISLSGDVLPLTPEASPPLLHSGLGPPAKLA